MKERYEYGDNILVGTRSKMLTCIEDRDFNAVDILCDCGTTKTITRACFKRQISCGCKRSTLGTKHGHLLRGNKSPTYMSWASMKARTTNPNNPAWPDYGGRGILLCARWLEFKNFLADMGERPKDTTLDRIDNKGNYEVTNCRWADKKTQRGNQRKVISNRFLNKCIELLEEAHNIAHDHNKCLELVSSIRGNNND